MSSIGIGRISSADGLNAVEARTGLASVAPAVEAVPRAAAVAPFRDALSSAMTPHAPPSGAGKAGAADAGIVARATDAARAGAYSIEVTQVAREHRSESTALASSTAPLGMVGSIQLAVGDGVAHAIAVAREDSLLDVAVKINTSGARVDASVVFAGGSYKLSLRGLGTGADSAVSVREAGVALGLSDPTHLLQSAQDARVKVDGVERSSPTNQIAGAIDGVTLAVTHVTASPTVVHVGAPGDATRPTEGSTSGHASAKKHVVSLPSLGHTRTALDRLHRMKRVPDEHGASPLGASPSAAGAAPIAGLVPVPEVAPSGVVTQAQDETVDGATVST